MIRSEFMAAINQICAERGIEPESVLETLKHAIKAAYRKDYEESESASESEEGSEIEVKINKESGQVSVWKEEKEVTPPGFGRIAAQTAKQVILQGVREAEKTAIIDEFQAKVGTIVSGMLQRREGMNWIVDLGRTTALLPRTEQIINEDYRHNQRLYFYIKEIEENDSRYNIIVSRNDNGLISGLFRQEIPEVTSGAIEIKAIAREPGQRSKVAVASMQDGVDAVGSCVGQRGVRVQAITDELSGERIDVILWNADPLRFVAAALSPAEVINLKIDEKDNTAFVQVPEDQLSLAIGKEGQNARLAAKLTGYRIDIHGDSESLTKITKPKKEIPASILKRLEKAKLTPEEAFKMSPQNLMEIEGIGPKTIEALMKLAKPEAETKENHAMGEKAEENTSEAEENTSEAEENTSDTEETVSPADD